MNFNSAEFFIFFPCAVTVYYLIPCRFRNIWLLICSYVFYMAWNPVYILLLMATTLVTYASGILLSSLKDKEGSEGKRKAVVALSLVINLSMLIYFKYTGFLLTSVNRLINAISGVSPINTDFAMSIVLPVGISFFIFQALSYTIDVYRGNVEAEKNIIDYALFVSFFPQLVAGPIERSGNLLTQIRAMKKEKLYDYQGIIRGLILMAWGFFMKMAIADRLSMITDPVFDDHGNYGAGMLVLSAVSFTIQIYCDFAGYSMIAIGAARVMGVKLMENFNTPYLSGNVRDFWNRWHISLSSWLRDYLYFPLGGSRCSKKRTYFNLMVTFLISGLWHGAAAKFIVWGGIHGLLQVFSRACGPAFERVGKLLKIKEGLVIAFVRVVINFAVVTFAWIFFRADSLKLALDYIINMFNLREIYGFIRDRGYTQLITDRNLAVTGIAVLILTLVDLIKYKTDMRPDDLLMKMPYPVRAILLMMLIFFVIIFGQYGSDVYVKPFVYFQF